MKAFKLIAGPACSIQSRDCKDNVLEVKTRPRFRGLAPIWAKIQEKPFWISIDPLYFSSFVPTVLPTNIAWWEWTHERGGLDVEMNFVSRFEFFLVSPHFLNYYHYPFESAPSSVIPFFLPPPDGRGQKLSREQELSQKTFGRRVKAMSGFCIPLSRDYNRVLVPLDKNWWDDQLEFLCKCTSIYQKFNPHIFVSFSAWHCVTSHS